MLQECESSPPSFVPAISILEKVQQLRLLFWANPVLRKHLDRNETVELIGKKERTPWKATFCISDSNTAHKRVQRLTCRTPYKAPQNFPAVGALISGGRENWKTDSAAFKMSTFCSNVLRLICSWPVTSASVIVDPSSEKVSIEIFSVLQWTSSVG